MVAMTIEPYKWKDWDSSWWLIAIKLANPPVNPKQDDA